MRGGNSDLIDLALVEHHRSDGAILVSEGGDRDKVVWLPLSLVDVEVLKGIRLPRPVEVTLPEWLAKDRGLI